jgi:hypothetical protein
MKVRATALGVRSLATGTFGNVGRDRLSSPEGLRAQSRELGEPSITGAIHIERKAMRQLPDFQFLEVLHVRIQRTCESCLGRSQERHNESSAQHRLGFGAWRWAFVHGSRSCGQLRAPNVQRQTVLLEVPNPAKGRGEGFGQTVLLNHECGEFGGCMSRCQFGDLSGQVSPPASTSMRRPSVRTTIVPDRSVRIVMAPCAASDCMTSALG